MPITCKCPSGNRCCKRNNSSSCRSHSHCCWDTGVTGPLSCDCDSVLNPLCENSEDSWMCICNAVPRHDCLLHVEEQHIEKTCCKCSKRSNAVQTCEIFFNVKGVNTDPPASPCYCDGKSECGSFYCESIYKGLEPWLPFLGGTAVFMTLLGLTYRNIDNICQCLPLVVLSALTKGSGSETEISSRKKYASCEKNKPRKDICKCEKIHPHRLKWPYS